jgi:hypothetical protein
MNVRRTRWFGSAAVVAAPVLLFVSPAAAQWWWPPGLSTDPTCPDPSTQIEVTLSGDWPDACPPNTAHVVITGSEIDLNISRDPPPGFCLTVITPWSLPVTIGQLPAGMYSVYSTYYLQGLPATSRDFVGTLEVCGGCYPNCDGSTTPPILNVEDFTCFINEFAQAATLPHEQQVTHYANCDGSTTPPVLNVEDFTCFINAFAAGCP